MQIQLHLDIRWVDRGLVIHSDCIVICMRRLDGVLHRLASHIVQVRASVIITAVQQEAYCAVSLCRPDHGAAPLLCMRVLIAKATCAADDLPLSVIHV